MVSYQLTTLKSYILAPCLIGMMRRKRWQKRVGPGEAEDWWQVKKSRRGEEGGAKVTARCWPPNKPTLTAAAGRQSKPKTLLKVDTLQTTISGCDEYTITRVRATIQAESPVLNSLTHSAPTGLWKDRVLFCKITTSKIGPKDATVVHGPWPVWAPPTECQEIRWKVCKCPQKSEIHSIYLTNWVICILSKNTFGCIREICNKESSF